MIDFLHKGVYEFIKFTLQKPESQNFLDPSLTRRSLS